MNQPRVARRWWWRILFALLLAGVGGVLVFLDVGTSWEETVVALPATILALVAINRPELLTRGSLNFFLPLGVAAICHFVTPEVVGSTEFYKAAAGILPTLLLIFFIDKQGVFHASNPGSDQRFGFALGIVLLIVGGVETLKVLAFDDSQVGNARHVVAAIGASVTLLIISFLTPPVSDGQGEGLSQGAVGGSIEDGRA